MVLRVVQQRPATAVFRRPHGEQRKGGRGQPGPAGPAPIADYAAIWASIQKAAGPELSLYNVRMPPAAGQPATVFYLRTDSPHERAFNQIVLDPATGVVKKHERYDDKSYKAQLLTSIYALHVGSYWGLTGRILVTAASLTMPLFFITGWLLYLDRRRKKRHVKQARQGFTELRSDAPSWLIGFASQSGFAEQLAWQTAGQLQASGLPVRVQPLSALTEDDVQNASNALFVVSTFGDGEAPDSARGFERKVVGQPLALNGLTYGVLALGDRQYPDFCGFATRIEQWLNERGAQSLFSPVHVDNGDTLALQQWQQQLSQLTGGAPSTPWQAPRYSNWTLEQRDRLNPGSLGSSAYLLGLSTPTTATRGRRVIWSKSCHANAPGR